MNLKSKSLQELFLKQYPLDATFSNQKPQSSSSFKRMSNPLDLGLLMNHWEKIVGEKIAKIAYPSSVNRKVLIIICMHNVQAFELNFHTKNILEAIHKELPSLIVKIKGIRFLPHYSEFLELQQLYEENNSNNIESISIKRPTLSSVPSFAFHPKSPAYRLVNSLAKFYVQKMQIQSEALIEKSINMYIRSLTVEEEDKLKIEFIEAYLREKQYELIAPLEVECLKVHLLINVNNSKKIFSLYFDKELFQLEKNFFMQGFFLLEDYNEEKCFFIREMTNIYLPSDNDENILKNEFINCLSNKFYQYPYHNIDIKLINPFNDIVKESKNIKYLEYAKDIYPHLLTKYESTHIFNLAINPFVLHLKFGPKIYWASSYLLDIIEDKLLIGKKLDLNGYVEHFSKVIGVEYYDLCGLSFCLCLLKEKKKKTLDFFSAIVFC